MLSRRVFLRQLAAIAAGILASHKPGHGGATTGHARVTWAELQTPTGGGGSSVFQTGVFQTGVFQGA